MLNVCVVAISLMVWGLNIWMEAQAFLFVLMILGDCCCKKKLQVHGANL